jgi:SAM-dependent methyltransferase
MVGDPGAPGGPAAELTGPVRAAYDAGAEGWDIGPGLMYRDLARALVASAPVPVAGASVLDLGAGTGVAGSAALAAGAAQVVAADLAPRMLARCPPALLPVAADANALPFRDRSFGLVLAAFCLGHLPDLTAGLAEARRVGAAIAASAFAPGWTHPAKAAVDQALAAFGYRPPAWYLTFKRQTEPRSGDPDLLGAAAADAGFGAIRVRTVAVATSVTTPEQLAAWRLGMAHVAPFVAGLAPRRRAALRRAAESAVARSGAGALEVSMLTLTARSPTVRVVPYMA